jgi:peptide/nickel transport system substrate-binding protein
MGARDGGRTMEGEVRMSSSSRPEITRRDLLKKGAVAGGFLIGGPWLLSACGGASSTASILASLLPTPLATSGASPAVSPSFSPKLGGSLKFGIVGDVQGFDPYMLYEQNFAAIANLNRFLIYYDDMLKPTPGAASSWDIAADHTSVTVHLKPGIKFQTGKLLTSDDVIYGLQRAADPKEGAQIYGRMSVVSSYSAVDDQTVVIKFTQPVSDQLMTDLLEAFPVVDKAGNNSASLAIAPASAGPFTLKAYTPGATIELGKYADYDESPLPYLDSVTLEVFDTADTMTSGLQSGAIDGALYVTAKNASTLAATCNIVRGYPGALVNVLRLNPSAPPFDNLALRQAVQRAINRDKIVQEVYYGFGNPVTLPWGPNSPAYDHTYDTKLSYDLDAAKQLWIQAGKPSSGEAVADGTDSQTLEVLQIIQADLSSIGFDLKISTQDPQTFMTNVVSANFGAVIDPIGNSNKSPSGITDNSLFRVANNPLWKANLPSAYVSAIKASESALTDADVSAANAQLNTVISDLAWGIGINTLLSLFAVSKNVVGLSRDVDDHVALVGTSVGS